MKDRGKKHTREYAIRHLWTIRQLAAELICDDEPYVCGYNDVYFASDGEGYYDYENALEHEIWWLKQEVSDCE